MLEIAGNEVHLWFVFEPDVPESLPLDSYMQWLGARELARYDRLRQPADKRQFLLTQALGRYVLAQYLGLDDPAHINFERNPFGKPFLAGAGVPAFNLSNSHGFIALAVTAGTEVGVDVEYLHRQAACARLAQRYFTPVEAATFAGLDDAALRDRFFDYWTLKEAWLKAYGTGLKTPLDTFSLVLQDDSVRASFSPRLDQQDDGWCFRQYDVATHFRLSLSLKAAPDSAWQVSARQGAPLQGFEETVLESRRGC